MINAALSLNRSGKEQESVDSEGEGEQKDDDKFFQEIDNKPNLNQTTKALPSVPVGSGALNGASKFSQLKNQNKVAEDEASEDSDNEKSNLIKPILINAQSEVKNSSLTKINISKNPKIDTQKEVHLNNDDSPQPSFTKGNKVEKSDAIIKPVKIEGITSSLTGLNPQIA